MLIPMVVTHGSTTLDILKTIEFYTLMGEVYGVCIMSQ